MTTDKSATLSAKTSAPADAPPVGNPEVAEGAATVVDPRLLIREQGFAGYVTEFKRKISGGDLGSIPVVVGLAIIAIVFQSMNPSSSPRRTSATSPPRWSPPA